MNLPSILSSIELTRGEDGAFRADSRDVAARFGKQHGHVLRDIDALIAQGAPRSNFGEGSYQLPSTGSQNHRLYRLTRDGFSLLAMGFTGAEALQWKLAYIEAFNAMEKQIAPEQALIFLGINPTVATALVQNHRDTQLALQQSNEALELARIAEAKAQASTLQARDYSILAWANLHGIDLPNSIANTLGRRAAALSRARGVPMGSAPDARWGSVNTYMDHILEEVFAAYADEP